jgi:hypothetical protein
VKEWFKDDFKVFYCLEPRYNEVLKNILDVDGSLIEELGYGNLVDKIRSDVEEDDEVKKSDDSDDIKTEDEKGTDEEDAEFDKNFVDSEEERMKAISELKEEREKHLKYNQYEFDDEFSDEFKLGDEDDSDEQDDDSEAVPVEKLNPRFIEKIKDDYIETLDLANDKEKDDEKYKIWGKPDYFSDENK